MFEIIENVNCGEFLGYIICYCSVCLIFEILFKELYSLAHFKKIK